MLRTFGLTTSQGFCSMRGRCINTSGGGTISFPSGLKTKAQLNYHGAAWPRQTSFHTCRSQICFSSGLRGEVWNLFVRDEHVTMTQARARRFVEVPSRHRCRTASRRRGVAAPRRRRHDRHTQAMQFSAFKGPFEERIESWNHKLFIIGEVLDKWLEVRSRRLVPCCGWSLCRV